MLFVSVFFLIYRGGRSHLQQKRVTLTDREKPQKAENPGGSSTHAPALWVRELSSKLLPSLLRILPKLGQSGFLSLVTRGVSANTGGGGALPEVLTL